VSGSAAGLKLAGFFPVSTVLSVTMFHFFDFTNPVGYHVLQILIIGLSCYYFAVRFVDQGSKRIAAVLLLCAMSAYYWSFHDPYVSYHLVMPVFTLFFLGSVAYRPGMVCWRCCSICWRWPLMRSPIR
jgi:hypothetical protein